MKVIASVLALLFAVGGFAAAPTAKDLLETARRSRQPATYAMLEGTLQHRRRGSGVLEYPVYFGMIQNADRVTAQLILAHEGYLIGQSRRDGSGTVTPMKPAEDGKPRVANRVGVRGSDLTMGFLYYEFKREVERVRYNLYCPACVVELYDSGRQETIRVWLAESGAFPLKAEFYRRDDKTPYRTLEADGFTRKNDLYFPSTIRLYGPGWRTRIEFDSGKAKVGLFNPDKPVNIIR